MSFLGLLQEVLLRESATPEQVCKAIDNHSYVIINYHTKGEDDNTGSRIIIPVAYGLTSASNPVLRAYQPIGDTTTSTNRWKYFRLDRISYWEETKKRFYEDDLPKEYDNVGVFNPNGDNSMQIVNHILNFNTKSDAANGVNVGPKTKEKIRAVSMDRVAQTSGDEKVKLGARNIKNQQSNIKVDLDNNRKANSSFNIYTDNTPSIESGPRMPDKSYNPRNASNSTGNNDIDQNELEKLRKTVQNIDRKDILNNDDIWSQVENEPKFSDYSHEWNDDEISQAQFDRQVMNRNPWQNRDMSVSKRKWDRYANGLSSSDRMFKNRKDSGNRTLYDMEHEND